MKIQLPDNSVLYFEKERVDGFAVAEKISRSLLKKALAMEVNGEPKDLSHALFEGDKVRLITVDDEAGLDIIRHSTAHLLAQAMSELYPGVQIAIGPVIRDGFYYDADFGEHHITDADLPKLEKRMREIAKRDDKVAREDISREAAIQHFNAIGQPFKAKIIEELPLEVETVSLYRHGDFVDLCRGPHVPRMGLLKAFKLMSLSGAYWRGDSQNPMLQRIYGTAFADKAGLDAHLHKLEEAAKRDHRVLGERMRIFFTDPVAPGMPFWMENGTILYNEVVGYMRARLREGGYAEVRTPAMMDIGIWENSGHREKFGDNMFTTQVESREYAIKPMNCPGGLQIYNHSLHSYRDLPLRMGEFGYVHRFESSGTLHGLMRVRAFTQDDAHIFCTPAQMMDELKSCVEFVYSTYRDFGLDKVTVKVSTRPEKRIGSDEIWDKSEQALFDVLESLNIPYGILEGEGAFYGPKYEFTFEDAIGRDWQCGTVQLDFSMPSRLCAFYVDSDGERKVPVMIHRAILGSFERFIGILLEHYAGKLPLWLAPVQAIVLPLSERFHEHAKTVHARLTKAGVRASLDLRSEKLGYKIREATLAKHPVQIILGEKELENGSVSVRYLDDKEESMHLDGFLEKMQKAIERPYT